MAIAIFMAGAAVFMFCACVVRPNDREKMREDEEQEVYLAEQKKKRDKHGADKEVL